MSLREKLWERRLFARVRKTLKRFTSKLGWEISTDELCFPGKPLNRFFLHPRVDVEDGTVRSPERQIVVELSFEDQEIRIIPALSAGQEALIPFSDFTEDLLTLKLEESCRETSVSEPRVAEPDLEEFQNTLALGWYYSESKGEFQLARIAEKDRATHLYVMGATGTGKTKFLEFLIQQDIEKGNGFGVIDPHGDLIEDVKGFIACHYHYSQDLEILDRVVLIDPTDPEFTVTFNPLEELPNVSIAEQASELIAAFRKIWRDSWGPRMEDLMRTSLIALGETGHTLADLPRFLTDESFRDEVLKRVSHPIVLGYFQRFNFLSKRTQLTWIEPVMNKINAFLADKRIRDIFSAPQSTFNLREIMDEGKILLVKLDKGRLKGSADLLGSLLLAKLQMAAFSRSELPPNKRRPFYLYIDEFQNFATESFGVLLSEARKYGLSLILAHQTLAQISRELKGIILANTGFQVYFRLNRQDAQTIAKEAFEYSGYEVKTFYGLHPIFWTLGEEWEQKTEELQNLPPRCCWAKHKIQGGIIPLFTVEIEPPREALGMEEEEYYRYLKELPIGRKYLVPKRELGVAAPSTWVVSEKRKAEVERSQPKRRPREEVFPRPIGEREKEVPALVFAEAQIPEKTELSQHRYLQILIKRIAEEKGFRAEIEKPILGGKGRVDLELEIDGRKIACEISVTSSPLQELENVKKCLAAGYEEVILCSPKAEHLQRIRKLVSEELKGVNFQRVIFFQPENLFSYLEEVSSSTLSKEERIKGYRVKIQYQPVNEEEERARREAIARIIFQSLGRRRNKG